MDNFVIDTTLRAALTALDGLSLRQQAISRNVANIDTPGYKAETVNFEEALNTALKPKKTLALAVTDSRHISLKPTQSSPVSPVKRQGGAERADGNNVDIDTELLDMSETGITYQAISQAITKKLSLLKTIASS